MLHNISRVLAASMLATLCVAGVAVAQTPPSNTPPAPVSREKIPAPPPDTLPPGEVQGTTAATGIDQISGAPGFSTFAKAIAASGLADMLRGQGPYTIFAPSDAAFARIPAGQLQDLLKPENRERLRSILMYHIVPGNVTADDVRNMRQLPTTLGEPVVLKKTATGAFTVNGANITERDVQASNGQIQIIDSVLFPNRRTPPDEGKNATQ